MYPITHEVKKIRYKNLSLINVWHSIIVSILFALYDVYFENKFVNSHILWASLTFISVAACRIFNMDAYLAWSWLLHFFDFLLGVYCWKCWEESIFSANQIKQYYFLMGHNIVWHYQRFTISHWIFSAHLYELVFLPS